MTAAVSMRSVTKRFDDVVAVDSLDLDIAYGRILALRISAWGGGQQ